MQVIDPKDRTPELIDALVTVWERSVRATHLFLSNEEILQIKPFVPEALAGIPVLVAETGRDGAPVAFMGIDGCKLEMLFVDPDERGHGMGKRLLTHGIRDLGVKELSVNEQNPQARGFYEHMGFTVRERSETDDQGNPYPILRMELA